MNTLFIFDNLDTFDFLSLIGVVASIPMVLFSIYFNSLLRRKTNSNKEKAFDLLLSRYGDNVLDADSVRLIYEEESNKGDDFSFEDFLKSFIVYVTKKEAGKGDKIKGIEQVIKPLLLKERTIKPYSNLEEEERQLLLSIESFTKNESGQVPESVKYNLDGLASKIEKNQKSVKFSKKMNWASITLAAIGIFLTVFSFIRKPSISEESIKNISTEVSKQVVDSLVKCNANTVTIQKQIENE